MSQNTNTARALYVTREAQKSAHLLPSSCYVCGDVPRANEASPDCAHDFTNAEAAAKADAYDRHVTYSPEAAYVDATRGR